MWSLAAWAAARRSSTWIATWAGGSPPNSPTRSLRSRADVDQRPNRREDHPRRDRGRGGLVPALADPVGDRDAVHLGLPGRRARAGGRLLPAPTAHPAGARDRVHLRVVVRRGVRRRAARRPADRQPDE